MLKNPWIWAKRKIKRLSYQNLIQFHYGTYFEIYQIHFALFTIFARRAYFISYPKHQKSKLTYLSSAWTQTKLFRLSLFMYCKVYIIPEIIMFCTINHISGNYEVNSEYKFWPRYCRVNFVARSRVQKVLYRMSKPYYGCFHPKQMIFKY